jgi:hypothetical protein
MRSLRSRLPAASAADARLSALDVLIASTAPERVTKQSICSLSRDRPSGRQRRDQDQRRAGERPTGRHAGRAAAELGHRAGSLHGIYRALGLLCIPPELREDRGQIEAAAEGHLPKLLTREDLSLER